VSLNEVIAFSDAIENGPIRSSSYDLPRPATIDDSAKPHAVRQIERRNAPSRIGSRSKESPAFTAEMNAGAGLVAGGQDEPGHL
jgi:hypothetical protein